jgi:superoxide oxidase
MMYTTLLDDLQADYVPGHRYDALSIILHWTTVVLLAAILWTAYGHETAQDGATAARMLLLHRSLGILVWLLTIGRLGWKALFGNAPALPSTIGRSQRAVAWSVQALLYGLLLLLPITGLSQSLLRGRSFPLIFGDVPAVVARNKAAAQLFHELHEKGAIALFVLIGLHALAGLYHGLVRRDGVLGTMLPIVGSKDCAHKKIARRE